MTAKPSSATILAVETIRAFVAIELSDEVKQALRNVQDKLRGAPGSREVRWVAPENMHLTLKFLGNVDRARLTRYTAALEQAAAGIPRFNLTAHALGCFPNTRKPNVIWVGLEGDLPTLLRLVQQVEEAFGEAGLEREERAFSPHLTLGRVRREARPVERAELGATIERFPRTDYGSIVAEKVHFIQSDLRPSGPVYSILGSARLTANADG